MKNLKQLILNTDSALERVLVVHKYYKDEIGMITGLGTSGICLLKILEDAKIRIPVYFVDTGFNFKETINLKHKIEERFNINIITLTADKDLRNFVFKKYSKEPCGKSNNICCHLLKVAPLLEVLPSKNIWMSGLRMSQSKLRSSLNVYGLDGRGTFKFHPLFDWTYDDVKNFIDSNDLPYNPLLNLGYKSVGCMNVTMKSSKTKLNERSGRWMSSDQTECGINIF